MNLTDLAIESNVPIPEKKKRGRPKGQTVQNTVTLQKSLPKLIPDLDPVKIQNGVIDDLSKTQKRRKQAQGYSIVGSLNKAVAAIEFEEVKETSEQKERTKEQLKEVDWWRKLCNCTHSRTAHKTDGTGGCMICECEHYE